LPTYLFFAFFCPLISFLLSFFYFLFALFISYFTRISRKKAENLEKDIFSHLNTLEEKIGHEHRYFPVMRKKFSI